MNSLNSLYDKLKNGQASKSSNGLRASSSIELNSNDETENWFKEAESDPICPSLVSFKHNIDIKQLYKLN